LRRGGARQNRTAVPAMRMQCTTTVL